jgi:hypothetical protein
MARTTRCRSWSGRRLVVLAAAALVVGGSATRSSAQVGVTGPDIVGQWTAPFEEGGVKTPRCHKAGGRIECKPVAQAASVLPDGRIFYFNGAEGDENVEHAYAGEFAPSSRNSQSRVLDLRTGVPQWVVPTPADGGGRNPNIKPGHKSTDDPLGMAGVPGRPGDGLVGSTWGALGGPPHDPWSTPDDSQANSADLFCSDVTQLPDGRLLMAGGTDWYNEPDVMQKDRGDPADVGFFELEGLRMGRVFDGRTNSFTLTEPKKYGRWYPSTVALPDGKVLVASGVFKLTKATQASNVRRTETYDPQTNRWIENYTGPESENSLPLVARLFLTPNGKIFYDGTGQAWNPLGQGADEAMWGLQQFFDPEAKRWEITGPAALGYRGSAGDVMLRLEPPYDKATILTFGGTLLPTPGSYVATTLSTLTTVDKDGHVATEMTGNLNIGRWFPSGVLLPDGEVFTANGADRDELFFPGIEIAIRTPELYDPRTGRWAKMVDQARDRTYHSSALLLPDARVMIGGHSPGATGFGYRHDMGKPFANNDKDSSFEVWSPPYLFRGERPVIRGAQAGVAWGETFSIHTPQAGDIESVQLMRLPSVQHTIDSDQRGIMLSFTREGEVLRAVAPPSGTVAPPGYYYLFVNRRTDKGPVPSVARIVRVGSTSDPAEAVQPMPDDVPAPTGSATEDADTSMTAKAHKSLGQVAGRGASGRPTAAVPVLQARPARNSRRSQPALPPLVPVALAAVGTTVVMGRRWLVPRPPSEGPKVPLCVGGGPLAATHASEQRLHRR